MRRMNAVLNLLYASLGRDIVKNIHNWCVCVVSMLIGDTNVAVMPSSGFWSAPATITGRHQLHGDSAA
jgi:hypothetical protein